MLPEIPRAETPVPEQHTYLHPINWRAFEVFVACFTQWRLVAGGMGGIVYQGLDYTAVWTVIKAYRCKNAGRVFRQIQYIETGALSEING